MTTYELMLIFGLSAFGIVFGLYAIWMAGR